MGMKIGILCAGDQELAPFLPRIGGRVKSEKAQLICHSGQITGVPVAALYSGVCKTNAALAAQVLIDTYGCTALINAGTAGGMAQGVQLLDLVVATHCAHWDVAPDILTEFHPYVPGNQFPCDAALLTAARRTQQALGWEGVHFGPMVTGESFITQDNRVEINRAFAPLSVDMETASVAQVCYANGIPFLSVRAITDTAQHSGLEEFAQNCDNASEKSAAFVAHLIGLLGAEHGK